MKRKLLHLGSLAGIFLLLGTFLPNVYAAKPVEWPEVKDLPVQRDMPDAMTMNDGTRVTTPRQ